MQSLADLFEVRWRRRSCQPQSRVSSCRKLTPHLQSFTVIATSMTVPVGTSRKIGQRLKVFGQIWTPQFAPKAKGTKQFVLTLNTPSMKISKEYMTYGENGKA
jgi:hypothetical protein